jgi:hypothetical protein
MHEIGARNVDEGSRRADAADPQATAVLAAR